MKLNGWQRLWVVIVTPWTILWIVFGTIYFLNNSYAVWSDLLGGFFACVIPPLALYGFGWGIAWARRGFRGE